MSEWRVRQSRRLNRLLGDKSGQMFCSRVYVQARIYGGGWIWAETVINIAFLYRETQHVRRTYIWERRHDPPTYQGATRTPKEAPSTQQASTAGNKTPAKGGDQCS